jgi:phage tail-like protein
MPDREPFRNFNFRVEIDGIAELHFAEVAIPAASIAVVEYREGGNTASASRKLPGRASFGNVVLRRGVTSDLQLYHWFRAELQGDHQPRTVTIVLQDAQHRDVRRWVVRDAWIARWEGPELDASANEVAIETIELACESVEIVD